MNFSFKNGDKSYNDLGETLYHISKIAPSGILVVFSSYVQMNKCYEEWQLSPNHILQNVFNL